MQNAKTSFDPSVSESQNFGWQNLGFPFILIREANQPRLKMFSKSRWRCPTYFDLIGNNRIQIDCNQKHNYS